MRLWRAVREGVDAFVRELQTGRRIVVPPTVVPISNQAKSVDELELAEAEREAVARKHRTEARLRDEGVPFIRHLPRIETRDEVKLRTKEEIAYRSLALTVVTVKAIGMRQPSVENAVKHLGLAPHFSPRERGFILDPKPPHQDVVHFSWSGEAAWPLFWALGFVHQLDRPIPVVGERDLPEAVHAVQDHGAGPFIDGARLRSLDEVLDETDLIYRYHWAVREAWLRGRKMPAGLDPGVVEERHHALNWLVVPCDEQPDEWPEWDEVDTST
jgi:Domain of unknown function (DUF4272)